MNLTVPPGKYVLAVSGGVDSMVLLDVLSERSDLCLVVAHFDHGIRPESYLDEELIRKVAGQKGLSLEVGHGGLDSNASEDKARQARYEFLNKFKKSYGAQAIITAHHQDDLIETAFWNLIRGTNRQGLTAINNSLILRPMLSISKKAILDYAEKKQLEWIEDNTNNKDTYLRNYLRRNILKDLKSSDRQLMLKNLEKVAYINRELNERIATLSHSLEKNAVIDREKFTLLPSEVAHEVMAYWLKDHKVRDFDKRTVQRLSLGLKTARANTKEAVKAGVWLKIDHKTAHFTTSG